MLCKVNSAVCPMKLMSMKLIFHLLLDFVKRARQSFTICEGDIWSGLTLKTVYMVYAKLSLGVLGGTSNHSPCGCRLGEMY